MIENFLKQLITDGIVNNANGDLGKNTNDMLKLADEVWQLAISPPGPSDNVLQNDNGKDKTKGKAADYPPFKPGCLFDKVVKDGNENTVIDPDRISASRFTETLPDGKTQIRPVIDLVQQGGGMFGIALAGYTYIMEKAGIRFYSLGGTSAGGINTMLLGSIPNTIYQEKSAFCSTMQATKSELLAHIIANADFSKFMDRGGITGRLQEQLFKRVRPKSFLIWFIIITPALSYLFYHLIGTIFSSENGLSMGQIKFYDFIVGVCMIIMPFVLYYTLMIMIIGRNFGINTGEAFYGWVKKILDTEMIAVKTTGDLELRLGRIVFNGAGPEDRARMVLISANLTHNRIVKFPERANDYWGNPNLVTPAAYIRSTMSIPFIFETFIPDESHTQGTQTANSVILRARFVDGGMLSNFPIREFHNAAPPRFPTFGVLLSENPVLKAAKPQIPPPAASPITAVSLFSYIISFISTFRNFYDNDYLASNDEIRPRVETVDTKKFNYINFWMPKQDKEKLFKAGAEAAIRQLEKFDWNEYKELRK